VDRFHPELDAFLQFIVYRISIWAQGERSYGQQLQNLKFAPLSLRQKLLYFLLTVGVPYAMKRWQAVYSWYHKLDDAPPMDVVRAVHRLERIYQVISVINFWFFLWNGQFVSVAHRLLNIKQTYIRTQMARKVSFEYMNRQVRCYRKFAFCTGL
jgi:peroxin-2